MYLGCNLRKAFLSGTKASSVSSASRDYGSVDVMVHEFCKLFGRYGGLWSTKFLDFLHIKSEDQSLIKEISFINLVLM